MVVQFKVTLCRRRFNKTIVRKPGAFGGLDCVDFHVEDSYTRGAEKEHLVLSNPKHRRFTNGACKGTKS